MKVFFLDGSTVARATDSGDPERSRRVGIDLKEMTPQLTAALVPEGHPLGAAHEVGSLAVAVVDVHATYNLVGGIDRPDVGLAQEHQRDELHDVEAGGLSLPARSMDLQEDSLDALETFGFPDLEPQIARKIEFGVKRAPGCGNGCSTVMWQQMEPITATIGSREYLVVTFGVRPLIAVGTADDDDTVGHVDRVSVDLLQHSSAA